MAIINSAAYRWGMAKKKLTNFKSCTIIDNIQQLVRASAKQPK